MFYAVPFRRRFSYPICNTNGEGWSRAFVLGGYSRKSARFILRLAPDDPQLETCFATSFTYGAIGHYKNTHRRQLTQKSFIKLESVQFKFAHNFGIAIYGVLQHCKSGFLCIKRLITRNQKRAY